jgi:uncharacterized protein
VIPSDVPWRRLDPALLRLRRLVWCAAVGVLSVTALPALLVGAGPVEALAGALVAVAVLLVGLVVVRRQVAAWGWAEREDDLLVTRGLLVRRLSVVPYGRMQYVDVLAGPLDRRYGLASVVLHTAAAATDARIPGLRAEDAALLRDRLAALGEARAAGV